MRTLEIANLPDDVYQQIEKLARIHGKSVAEQAADFLAKALAKDEENEAKLMAEIRADRELMASRGIFVTEEDVNRAKNWGRE